MGVGPITSTGPPTHPAATVRPSGDSAKPNGPTAGPWSGICELRDGGRRRAIERHSPDRPRRAEIDDRKKLGIAAGQERGDVAHDAIAEAGYWKRPTARLRPAPPVRGGARRPPRRVGRPGWRCSPRPGRTDSSRTSPPARSVVQTPNPPARSTSHTSRPTPGSMAAGEAAMPVGRRGRARPARRRGLDAPDDVGPRWAPPARSPSRARGRARGRG